MNADVILKMAQMQTLLDAVELLLKLRATAPAELHDKIDGMMQRLTTMGASL